jgi:hypothetical protein
MARFLTNAFIVLFIVITIYHFTGKQKENFPFSSFRMYRNLMPINGLVEYRLVDPGKPEDDHFLKVGDFRYYMKSRLDSMIRDGWILNESKFVEELHLLFEDPRLAGSNFKNYLFLVRVWDQFEAKNYKKPDRVYRFSLTEDK